MKKQLTLCIPIKDGKVLLGMKKPLSEYSTKPYDNRWCGWMKTCEAFIRSQKNDPKFERLLS